MEYTKAQINARIAEYKAEIKEIEKQKNAMGKIYDKMENNVKLLNKKWQEVSNSNIGLKEIEKQKRAMKPAYDKIQKGYETLDREWQKLCNKQDNLKFKMGMLIRKYKDPHYNPFRYI